MFFSFCCFTFCLFFFFFQAEDGIRDAQESVGSEMCIRDRPRVVATMAFVMGTDLAGPGLTVAAALTAVACVMPAAEVVDSRIASWQVQVADTIADNASAGKGVLGGRITPVGAGD